MKNITYKILTITSTIALGIILTTITIQNQQIQAMPHGGINTHGQKIYALAAALPELMDPMTYTNGDLIQFSAQSLPTITIERWNDLSVVDRAQIESQALTDNWHDITCAISLCI